MWYLFIHIPHLNMHELPTKYPREKKFWTHEKTHKEKPWIPRNNDEKRFCTQKIPTRKHF